MIVERIQKWDKADLQHLAEVWGGSSKQKDLLSFLQQAFCDRTQVIRVLCDLPPEEASMFHQIIADGQGMAKGKLVPAKGDAREAAVASLESLLHKGLAYVMKNRARLDDSIDRIHANEMVAGVLQDGGLLLQAAEQPCFEGITINSDPHADQQMLFHACGGVIPTEVLSRLPIADNETGQPSREQGIALIGSRFQCVCRREGTGFSEPIQQGEGEISTQGMAVACALIYYLRKKSLRVAVDGSLRQRDLEGFLRQFDFPESLVSGVLEHLLSLGLVDTDEEVLVVSGAGASWLSASLEKKQAILRKQSGLSLPAREIVTVGTIAQKALNSINLDGIGGYHSCCGGLQQLQGTLVRLWHLGVLRVFKRQDRIYAVGWARPPGKVLPEAGALLVSSNLELHVYPDRISPWHWLYLWAFASIHKKGRLAKGKLGEGSVVRGMMMGLSGDRFLRILDAGAEKELPQNVRFTLRDWVDSRRQATLCRVFLLNAEPATIEELLHDPRISPHIASQVGPGALILKQPLDRELVAQLERHHVFLAYEGTITDTDVVQSAASARVPD